MMTKSQEAELDKYAEQDKAKFMFALLSAESYIAWHEKNNGSMSQADRDLTTIEHVRGFSMQKANLIKEMIMSHGISSKYVKYVDDLKSLIAQLKNDSSYSSNQHKQMIDYLKTEIKALLFDNEEAA